MHRGSNMAFIVWRMQYGGIAQNLQTRLLTRYCLTLLDLRQKARPATIAY